jgi:hypothetical protein
MNIPGFTAEAAFHNTGGDYRLTGQSTGSHADTVIPAIPFCGNCDDILENCERNGGRPRAVCNACASGNCFSGVENPPPRPPWEWRPPWFW